MNSTSLSFLRDRSAKGDAHGRTLSQLAVQREARSVASRKGVDQREPKPRSCFSVRRDAVGGIGQCEVLEGSPGPTIVDAVARFNAEIVVVGSHGRTGLARVALGSVAERVVRDANVPVLVVRLM